MYDWLLFLKFCNLNLLRKMIAQAVTFPYAIADYQRYSNVQGDSSA